MVLLKGNLQLTLVAAYIGSDTTKCSIALYMNAIFSFVVLLIFLVQKC